MTILSIRFRWQISQFGFLIRCTWIKWFCKSDTGEINSFMNHIQMTQIISFVKFRWIRQFHESDEVNKTVWWLRVIWIIFRWLRQFHEWAADESDTNEPEFHESDPDESGCFMNHMVYLLNIGAHQLLAILSATSLCKITAVSLLL